MSVSRGDLLINDLKFLDEYMIKKPKKPIEKIKPIKVPKKTIESKKFIKNQLILL